MVKKKDVIVVIIVENPPALLQGDDAGHIQFYDTRNEVQGVGGPTQYETIVDGGKNISWCAVINNADNYPGYK
ncbi:MAG: hypothetical protein HKO90_06120, partial [Flavobacteriaceae bacterium]|nr:hypothetical protein [Flavobacteriaceae bacterium]